jgi:hypothetical protein
MPHGICNPSGLVVQVVLWNNGGKDSPGRDEIVGLEWETSSVSRETSELQAFNSFVRYYNDTRTLRVRRSLYSSAGVSGLERFFPRLAFSPP